MMTDAQENHLRSILVWFQVRADAKYRKGQEEHGGDLFGLSALELADAALDEAIDQVVYLKTLRDKLSAVKP